MNKTTTNLEPFILIWVDSSALSTEENRDTVRLLRKNFKIVEVFDDTDKFLQYIKQRSQDRIVLMISGRLGPTTVPMVHGLQQLVAAYIYCSDARPHKDWVKSYIKVKKVIVDLKELIERIKLDQVRSNEYKIDEILPISFFHSKSNEKQSATSSHNKTFIDFQMLIDCLYEMKITRDDKNELVQQLKKHYKNSTNDLVCIQEFEENYTCELSIWWLTRDSCISQMLNRSLLEFNIDLLYYFHFFIRDIYLQLDDNKHLGPIRTYRTQLMTTQDIKLLKSHIGELISINTFFFTTPNRARALELFQTMPVPNNLKRVLFEIDADPQLANVKSFNDITSLHYRYDTEIILFTAGTVFHPVDISQEKDILIIQMEISSDDDYRLQSIPNESEEHDYEKQINLLTFAKVLCKMKRFSDAEYYYKRVIEIMPKDQYSIVCCYQGFGRIAMEQQNYDLSLSWYKQALDIQQSILKSNDVAIAVQLNIIADLYIKKRNFTKALEFSNRELEIYLATLGHDHSKVALCYNNMATVFEMQDKYMDAIEYYQKVLLIYEKDPANNNEKHLALLHNRLADLYASIDKIGEALKHYNAAYKISMSIYSTYNLDTLKIMKNMAYIHETMGSLSVALAHYEKIASIHRQLLPANHEELDQIQQDIKRVFRQLK